MHTTTTTGGTTATDTTAPDTSPRTAARIAGVGYAALFVLAVFANFVVREGLVDTDDPAATVQNLVADETLYRLGMAAFLVVFLIDVVVAWALHLLLRPSGPAQSLLAAWFRLVHTVFLGIGVTSMFLALQLATDGALAAGLDTAQRESWTVLALEVFNYTWLIGLAAFGVHLVLIGRILAAGAGPRLLGLVLAVAGAAYLLDTGAFTLLAGYDDVAGVFLAIVAIPSVIAEFAFTIWLLRRGWGSDAVAGSQPVEATAAVRQPAPAGAR
jgi:hypothetical protein